MMARPDKYVLSAGEAGQSRLRLLQRVYGPSTEVLVRGIGVQPGMKVVDLGCGIGSVTTILARLVGPSGHATGVDMSPAHLAVARQEAAANNMTNVSWLEASAYATGLPRGSFDVAYCRFLLEHIGEPQTALGEMHALLKPGGHLVCEAIDVGSITTYPLQPVYSRLKDVIIELQRLRGSDGEIGPKLHGMFRRLGYAPRVAFDQPVFLTGEEKRFWELTFLEVLPALLQEGLLSAQDGDAMRVALAEVSGDDGILVAHARKVQTWAIKP